MHKCILEVTERVDQMKFNTAVSSLMTYVNYLSGLEKIAPELYETLLKLMCPFTPHLAEEMWARLGHNSLVITESWPKGDAKLAQDNVVTIAVQICGKSAVQSRCRKTRRRQMWKKPPWRWKTSSVSWKARKFAKLLLFRIGFAILLHKGNLSEGK